MVIQERSLNYENTTRTWNLLTMKLQSFRLLPRKCWLAMHQPSMKIVIIVNFLGWTRFEMWWEKIAILISSQIHGQPFSPAMNSRLKGNCEKSKSTCFIKSVAVFIIDGDVFIINIKGPWIHRSWRGSMDNNKQSVTVYTS